MTAPKKPSTPRRAASKTTQADEPLFEVAPAETPAKKRARSQRAKQNYVPKGAYLDTINPVYASTRDDALGRVPDVLRRRLAEKGVHARDVAQTMGLSLAVVRDRYQGKKPWALEELLGLAAVYDLDVADVLTSKESAEDRLARLEREMARMRRRERRSA